MNQELRQPGYPMGVYGFEVLGLENPHQHLISVESGAPTLTIVHEPWEPAPGGPPPAGTVSVEPERAEIWLPEGERIVLDRATLTVRYVTRKRPRDEVILHPYLGLPASIASYWLDRQTLHGGAFRLNEGAWAVVGVREAGKSSTLAWMLRRGHEIVTDDILVLDRGDLFAGPRSVDLRGEAAERLGGDELGVVGSRTRWRLRPGAVAPRTPLAGVVHLEWGGDVTIEPVPPARRLEALVQHCVIRPRPEESLTYLELASLPAWRVTRPRDLDGLEGTNEQLLAALPP
jgi:hypothetical protein